MIFLGCVIQNQKIRCIVDTVLSSQKVVNNEEDPFYDAPKPGSLPAGCKAYNQLDYFRQIIKVYQG